LIDYNERRPHESLAGETPASYVTKNAENSTLEMCA
jgi:transposase InsO family protein